MRAWYRAHYLDVMERYVAVARLPFRKRLQRAHEFFHARCWRPARFDTHPGWLLAALSALRDLTYQFPDNLVLNEARAVAYLRVARAALAVEQYRLGTGRLPTALSDLVPETLPRIPEDPFTGGPLKYKTLPNGFAAYSVGIDRTDDGGDGGLAGLGKDIVFAVQRRASAAPATAPAKASIR